MPAPRAVRPLAAVLPALALLVPAAVALPAGSAPPAVTALPPVQRTGGWSAYASCPDTPSVDWASPTLVRDTAAVTVRRYQGRQQGGRDLTLTVAAAHPGQFRLVARGATVVGRTRTTTETTSTIPDAVVAVNGGYFWRGDVGREWSKGAQVRDGRVFFMRAGLTHHLGMDATGAVTKGWAKVAGRAVAQADGHGPRVSLPVVAVNAAPAGGGVAVYTREWNDRNDRSGGSWEVYVRGGVVVSSSPSAGAVLTGSPAAQNRFVLRGAGSAVDQLRRIRPGQPMTYTARAVEARLGGTIRDATVGGTTLLVKGELRVSCSRVPIRPRTMVAWNRNDGRLWLVTASGGADAGAYGIYVGASYHQMALFARRLGASDASLVDGGGSTTMVVRTPAGVLRRVDGPFTGQRSISDVLAIVPK